MKSARALLKIEIFSTATYHCQQASEKALKAYLAFKRRPIIKTHDLIKLLDQCAKFDKDFIKQLDAAIYLNPFSTKFRYPTEYDIPDFIETERAVKYAQKIMKFVIKKIEEPETGQKELFKTNS